MGIEYINYSICKKCLKCYDICPMDVFRVVGKDVFIAYAEDCMCCFLCELECPADALKVTGIRTRVLPKPW